MHLRSGTITSSTIDTADLAHSPFLNLDTRQQTNALFSHTEYKPDDLKLVKIRFKFREYTLVKLYHVKNQSLVLIFSYTFSNLENAMKN